MSGIKGFSIRNPDRQKGRTGFTHMVELTVAESYTGAGSHTKRLLFGHGRAMFSTSERASRKMQDCDC